MSLCVLIKKKEQRDLNINIIDLNRVNNWRDRIQFQQSVCFNEEVVSREGGKAGSASDSVMSEVTTTA